MLLLLQMITSSYCNRSAHKNSDSNGKRSHNHLVRKQTLNHLAKLAEVVVGSCSVAVT